MRGPKSDCVKAIAAAKGKALALPAALLGGRCSSAPWRRHGAARRRRHRAGEAHRSVGGRLRRHADLRRDRRRLLGWSAVQRIDGGTMTDTPEIAAARIEVERSRSPGDGHGP